MSEILSVDIQPIEDNTIVKKQFLTYSPYTSTFGQNDETRITVQSQDMYVLPSESYITMEVKVSRKAGEGHAAAAGTWCEHYAMRLFGDIRYELNNVEIDRSKNPGMTTNLKIMMAYPQTRFRMAKQMNYYKGKALEVKTYWFMIPLINVLGFCEDYNKIIMNAKHELILLRSRNDISVYQCPTESFNIEVTKIQWKVPHVRLSDHAKLTMMRYLERNRIVTVPYRSWDLYEMPRLPETTKNIWTVKSTSQLNRPQFMIVAFQTDKQNITSDSSALDHCNISDVKLHMNRDCYPYENYNCDFVNENYHDLYLALLRTQHAYYPEFKGDDPFYMDYGGFGDSPIFAFDCSKTEEPIIIDGAVDIRIEINSTQNIPANTAAYCLMIYENQFEYSPFNGVVVKSK